MSIEINRIRQAIAEDELKFDGFKLYLQNHRLDHKEKDGWLIVGKENQDKTWILFINVIITQMRKLLERLVPMLKQNKVSFKIARNSYMAQIINQGDLGHAYSLKPIIIFTESVKQANDLIVQINSITTDLVGMRITDCLRVGNVCYTALGFPETEQERRNRIFNNRDKETKNRPPFTIVLPKKKSYPFPMLYENYGLEKKGKWLNRRYLIFSELRKTVDNTSISFVPYPVNESHYNPARTKGNIYKAVDMLRLQVVVIKKGNFCATHDIYERNIKDRLIWQHSVMQMLQRKTKGTPKHSRLFYKNDETYLVQDEQPGEPYGAAIQRILKGRNWKEIDMYDRRTILKNYIMVLDLIQNIHKENIIHRDITDSNINIEDDKRAYIFDFELAFSLSNIAPMPPYYLGTPGYVAPEQEREEIPTTAEDIYSLGILLCFSVTGIQPKEFCLESTNSLVEHRIHKRISAKNIGQKLFEKTRSKELVSIILRCIDAAPKKRPSISEIKEITENLLIDKSVQI